MDTIKIGTKVVYRGCWGEGAPKQAVIEDIELCANEGEKYGENVTEVPASEIKRCNFILDDGHWCYGYQVEKVID